MAFQWTTFNEFPHTTNYDSDLRELIAIVRTIENEYSHLVTGLVELQNAFDDIETDFNKIQKNFDDVLKSFQRLLATVNQLEDKMLEYGEDLEEIRTSLANVYNELAQLKPTVEKIVDVRIREYQILVSGWIGEVDAKVERYYKELKEEIEVLVPDTMYNRISGIEEGLVECIQNYFEASRNHALTNAEYEMLDMTNNEYAAWNITNAIYTLWSRDWLNHWWQFTGTNPVTGKKTRQSNVDSFLITEMYGTLTANGYTALNLTNTEYAALDLTDAEYLKYNTGYNTPAQLNIRLGGVEEGLLGVVSDLDGVATRVGTLETDLGGVTTRVGVLETDAVTVGESGGLTNTQYANLQVGV